MKAGKSLEQESFQTTRALPTRKQNDYIEEIVTAGLRSGPEVRCVEVAQLERMHRAERNADPMDNKARHRKRWMNVRREIRGMGDYPFRERASSAGRPLKLNCCQLVIAT